jgi:NAD(P)-dependent dehydrogenase (short-subunit alcohol dehydrogenase family)
MLVSDFFPGDLFKNQTVFVTGGSSGINFAIAKTFASLGANLAICARNQERLNEAAEKLCETGAKVVARAVDVRDSEQMQVLLDEVGSELGPIKVLVCAAAGNFPCPAEKLSPNGFKSVVDIDLLGSFNATHASFRQLKETRGSILFISAGMSYIPYFAQAHVGAAKAGVDNLMRNLALEWGRFGIRSNSIVPGPIEDTEGMNRLAPGKLGEKLKSMIPLQRFGSKDEIAQAAVFLSSPLASYITGTSLIVDGGQNLPGSGLFSQVIAEGMGEREKAL